MKSATRNILIVAAGVVVLGGAVAALMLTSDKESESSSAVTPEVNTIALVSKQEEDIVSMKVENENGGFTLIPFVEKVETATATGSSPSTGTKITYFVEELGETPVNTYATDRVVEYGFSLNASKNLGEIKNLEEYGLKKPKADVQVQFKDGSTYDYHIGNASAGDGSGYYMCGEDSNNVYIVSIDDGIFYGKFDFVKKDLLTITVDNNDTSEGAGFTKVALSGTNYPTPISIVLDAGYQMTAGRTMDVDEQSFTLLTNTLATLTADDVAYVNPTAEEIKTCGLDNPSAVVEITANKENYKVMAGATKDKQYFVMLDGGNVIYLISAEKADPWVNSSIYDLRSKFVNLPMITNVDTMTVSFSGQDNIFKLTRTKDEEKSTEDTPVYNYEVTGNGNLLTYDSNFKKYYQTIIAVQLLEYTDKKPTGTPDVVLNYHYYEDSGKKDDIVNFYKDGDRRYLVEMNGQTEGYVAATDVQFFMESTAKMLKDEEILTK